MAAPDFPRCPLADKFLYRALVRVNAYMCAIGWERTGGEGKGRDRTGGEGEGKGGKTREGGEREGEEKRGEGQGPP